MQLAASLVPFARLSIGVVAVIAMMRLSIVCAEERLSLDGTWQVFLDREDRFRPDDSMTKPSFSSVRLPGSLDQSGLGDLVDETTQWIASQPQGDWHQGLKGAQTAKRYLVPYWLRPNRRYLGRAWYYREIEIPEAWRSKSIELTLERPHWQTEVYIDRRRAGSQNSLSVPHRFDLTGLLSPGKHDVWIAVDNRIDNLDVGINSHSVSDQTQSAWHGIIGRIDLIAKPSVSIQSVQIYPSRSAKELRVDCSFKNTGGRVTEMCTLLVRHQGKTIGRKSFSVELSSGVADYEWLFTLEQAAPVWDEFEPNLCDFELILGSEISPLLRSQSRFGMRTVRIEGRQIYVNERAVFMRGTVECCIFPLTGYPPTDTDSWRKVFARCKECGLNHVRFHSWCPPEAAFVAADEAGVYLQIECSTWPNSSTSLGEGKTVDGWLLSETERIISEYGNHPSFLMLASGNEPGGKGQDSFLTSWLQRFKLRDNRRLMTSASGWPTLKQSDFHITPEPRLQKWMDGISSRINSQPPSTIPDFSSSVRKFDVPLIAHESGQWCTFPDLTQATKYTGNLQPENLACYQELLTKEELMDKAHSFMMDSGRQQVNVYKEEIETALRTPGFGGFQLLDIRDFPGQGNALVGMLDPFWDPKPYVSCDAIRRFCGPTIPLARLKRRVFTNDEVLIADLQIAHFGPKDLVNATTRWRLQAEEAVIAMGELTNQSIATGGLRSLGRMESRLRTNDTAIRLRLIVEVEAEGFSVENEWNIWVYPSQSPSVQAHSESIVHDLSDEAIRELESGKSLLWLVKPDRVATDLTMGFTPIFWNTIWTNRQSPHTLGIHCDPRHPALRRFVTDSHSDWQWWDLIHKSAAMDLSKLPASLKPVVQVIPDWNAPKRLGLIMEARVGNGKLLICSIDLQNQLGQRPVARQMRDSLVSYVNSEEFSPKTTLSVKEIVQLLRPHSNLQRLQASVTASCEHAAYVADHVMDGSLATIWHTPYGQTTVPFPHHLTMDLKSRQSVIGLKCDPRRESENGRIRRYRVFISDDLLEWNEVSSGTWPNDGIEKVVKWQEGTKCRYVRLTSEEGFWSQSISSLAEVDVILAGDSEESR
jgi:hypothetical protein